MSKIDYDKNWGSHLPILIKLVNNTTGPILELGMGLYSTPFLHWACYNQRELVSYDNDKEFFDLNKQYRDTFHTVGLVEAWDEVDLERIWEIALVDHAPSQRRVREIKRLVNNANFIVVHDTQRKKGFCDYDSIYSLFKYRYDYKEAIPWTTVLSNFNDPIGYL